MNINPLYQQMMMQQNAMNYPHPAQMSGMQFQNPVQKVNYIMQMMTNPAAFVKEQFPDVPDNIANDSGQVLKYIQQTRNISNDQLNQILNRYPRW